MQSLPFKVSPATSTREVGSPSVGVLVFPVHGSLLWAERDALRQLDEREDPFSAVAKLALAIAEAEGLEPVQAFGVVERILGSGIGASLPAGHKLSTEDQAIRLRHLERIRAFVTSAMGRGVRRQVALVTAGIRCRLQGCEDWSEVDTQRLPEALIEAVAEFMASEESAGMEAKARTTAELAEALGKSLPEPTADPPSPTGQPSSGDSSEPIQGTIDSVPSASPSSPSASSPAPSKRRTGRTARSSTRRSAPSPC